MLSAETKMTPTPEDLKTFAEAGGWNRYGSDECGDLWAAPTGGTHRLPDFLTNLQACVDVLERFCGDTDYSLMKYNFGDSTIYYCGIHLAFDEIAEGATLQIAIIQAVNAAGRKDDV